MSKLSSYKTYRKKWLGKAVDYDGVYGMQCVDLVKHFVKYFHSVNLGSFSGSAKAGWDSGSPFDNNWKKIPYKKGKIPFLGDVIFFDATKKNPYGHTAIVLGANATHIAILEQNAGKGLGKGNSGDEIQENIITYTSPYTCTGWYRYSPRKN